MLYLILRSNAFQQIRRFHIEITSPSFEIKTKKPNGKQKVNLLFDLNTTCSMFARMTYKNLQENQSRDLFCARWLTFVVDTISSDKSY